MSELSKERFPCRGTVYFTFASNAEDTFADGVFDAVVDALEAVGVFFEGGSTDRMDASDVIPDSPLALALGEQV